MEGKHQLTETEGQQGWEAMVVTEGALSDLHNLT